MPPSSLSLCQWAPGRSGLLPPFPVYSLRVIPPVSKAELLADVLFICTCLTGDNEAGSNSRRTRGKNNHFLPSSKRSIETEEECHSAFGPRVANLDGGPIHTAPKMAIKLHCTLYHCRETLNRNKLLWTGSKNPSYLQAEMVPPFEIECKLHSSIRSKAVQAGLSLNLSPTLWLLLHMPITPC